MVPTRRISTMGLSSLVDVVHGQLNIARVPRDVHVLPLTRVKSVFIKLNLQRVLALDSTVNQIPRRNLRRMKRVFILKSNFNGCWNFVRHKILLSTLFREVRATVFQDA